VSVTRIGSFTPNIDGSATPSEEHSALHTHHTQTPQHVGAPSLLRPNVVDNKSPMHSPLANLAGAKQNVPSVWSLMTPGFTVFLGVYSLLQLQSIALNVLCACR
jgi:hypothetical protein